MSLCQPLELGDVAHLVHGKVDLQCLVGLLKGLVVDARFQSARLLARSLARSSTDLSHGAQADVELLCSVVQDDLASCL